MFKAVACRARTPGFNPNSFQVSFSPKVALKKLKTADLKSFTVGTLRNNEAVSDVNITLDEVTYPG